MITNIFIEEIEDIENIDNKFSIYQYQNSVLANSIPYSVLDKK